MPFLLRSAIRSRDEAAGSDDEEGGVFLREALVGFARWSKEVVARDEQHVGLRSLAGIDAPVDANLARENVGLLSAWVYMTLGARAPLHAHQEGQAAIGVHSQDADLQARRSLEEGTVGLDRIRRDAGGVHEGSMTPACQCGKLILHMD